MYNMELPVLLIKLQKRVRTVEKKPRLNILEYMANDYDKMSTNDMERKYSGHPINFPISSSSIAIYLREYCHKDLRQGTEKIEKSKYYSKRNHAH